MDLISVIVPIYKVERYLDRCVESLVHQTYHDLEIILVDDGSPDHCPAMCDAWAEKDERIKVIHKKNGGLSDARNAGMEIAAGEYIGFVDSDDWVEPEMYELLYRHMKQDNADLSACGVQMVWEDGSAPQMLTPAGSYVLSQMQAMQAIIEESLLKQPVWYKLYKTDFVKNIPFCVGKCHEDVFWSYQAVGTAKIVSVFDAPCYHYVQRSGSIMGSDFSLKRLDIVKAKVERQKFIKEFFPDLEKQSSRNLFFSCMYHYQMVLLNPHIEDYAAALQYLENVLSQIQFDHKDLLSVPFKQGIWMLLGKCSFHCTCCVRNKLHIGC